jgi:sentrin-specific protease 1
MYHRHKVTKCQEEHPTQQHQLQQQPKQQPENIQQPHNEQKMEQKQKRIRSDIARQEHNRKRRLAKAPKRHSIADLPPLPILCYRKETPKVISCQCKFLTEHYEYQKQIRQSYSAFVKNSRDQGAGNKLLATFITAIQEKEKDNYPRNTNHLYRINPIDPETGQQNGDQVQICTPVFVKLFGMGKARLKTLQNMSKRNNTAIMINDCRTLTPTKDTKPIQADDPTLKKPPGKISEVPSVCQPPQGSINVRDEVEFVKCLGATEDVVNSDATRHNEDSKIMRMSAAADKKAASLMDPLTEKEKTMVHKAMNGQGPPDEVIAVSGPDRVRRKAFQTLRPGKWLNDEVIHFYFNMLSKRDEEMCKNESCRRRCHFFKSFFMTKLLNERSAAGTNKGKYEYNNVKRWSGKVPGGDIFNLDKIFFAINKGNSHWLCAVTFMLEKTIRLYDSAPGADGSMLYLSTLLRYIEDEHLDKRGCPLPDAHEWSLIPTETTTTPVQNNGKLPWWMADNQELGSSIPLTLSIFNFLLRF